MLDAIHQIQFDGFGDPSYILRIVKKWKTLMDHARSWNVVGLIARRESELFNFKIGEWSLAVSDIEAIWNLAACDGAIVSKLGGACQMFEEDRKGLCQLEVSRGTLGR